MAYIEHFQTVVLWLWHIRYCEYN